MITRITLRGFRGVLDEQVFKPERLTVVTGRNGLGKSTLFDAIDWCLFGESSRFGGDLEVVRNLYRPTQDPFVELHLMIGGKVRMVSRTPSGASLDGAEVSDRDLSASLMLDPEVFPPYSRDLPQHARAVTYLSQTEIRDFVSATAQSERKALFLGLLGVPNAGVVDAAARRVKDQLSVRERQILQQLNELSLDATATQGSPELDHELERDASEFLNAHPPSSSLVEALNRLGDDARLLNDEIELLDAQLRTVAEVGATIARSEGELGVLRRRQQSALLELGQASAELGHAADAVREVDEAHSAGIAKRTALGYAIGHVSAAITRAEQLTRRKAERDKTAAGLAEASARVDAARQDLSNFDREFRLRIQAAADYRRFLSISAEINLLNQRQEGLARSVALSRESIAKIEEEADRLKLQRIEIERSIKDAQVSHAALLRKQKESEDAISQAKQIDRLCEELLRLLSREETRCPFCSADYGNSEALRSHVAKRASKVVSSSHDVSKELRDSENTLRALSDTLQRTSNELAAAHSRRELLLAELTRDTADHVNVVENIRSLESSVSDQVSPESVEDEVESKKRAASLSSELGKQEAELERLKVEDERLNAEIRRLESIHQHVDSVGNLPELQAEMERTNNQVDEAARSAEVLRAVRAEKEARVANLRAELANINHLLEDEEGRATAARGRLAGLPPLEALDSVSLSEHRNELELRLDEVRRRLSETRETLSRASALRRREELNEKLQKESLALQELARLNRELAMINQASERFDIIANQLAERVGVEAQVAGNRHKVAIQECIDALYPHRHLNRVDVDFATGALRVTDRWLHGVGVSPEDYSSTGQANVFALSAFLGVALRQNFSLSRFVLLDEPVQNLDDLHFLAFLTLVKRIAMSRQIILSTADSNIAQILRRQLRVWGNSNRTWCEYEWLSFDPRSGPRVRRHDHNQLAVA